MAAQAAQQMEVSKKTQAVAAVQRPRSLMEDLEKTLGAAVVPQLATGTH